MADDIDDMAARAATAFRHAFDATIAIFIDEGGGLFIDARNGAPQISAFSEAAPEDAACVWRADAATLSRIFVGGRALDSAFLSGRLRVSGDMAVMSRLQLDASR